MNLIHGKYEIVADLTAIGRRAKTYKIHWHAEEFAVLKTYHPAAAAHFHREVLAMQELKKIDKYGVIAPLLEVGDLFFIIPYYEDTVSHQEKKQLRSYNFHLLPLSVAITVFKSLENFYHNGYEILEIHPFHIIIDKRKGVKIIDLEYAFPQMASSEIPFSASRTVHGADRIPDWSGSIPIGSAGGSDFFKEEWFMAVGVSLQSILTDPSWVQYCKKMYFIMNLFGRNCRAAWRALVHL